MVTLDRLVNVLAGYGVHLRFSSAPRTTVLRSVVIHESVAEDRTVAGDVLLAIGARSVKEALRWASAARAVAVLVRGDHATAFADESDDTAVMVVDPWVSWSELAGVVYGLVLEGRETAAGRGPTDLFALADSIADTVDGPITIEDRQSRVLAYSRLQQPADEARVETILNRQAPDRLRELFTARGVFTHLSRSDEPLFVGDDGHGLTGRMVVAVRAGRELLGSVWVTCRQPLEGDRRAALTDGARTVAMHMLRSRASADLERQVESDLVLRLLEGTADAATVASRLGLPQTAMRVVAVRAAISAQPHAGLLLAFERATSGFGWSRPGRSGLARDTVYTVLPGEQVEVARQWVDGLRNTLPAHVDLWAGISGSAEATELAAARQEADECLALHERHPSCSEPPDYDESWHDILLQRLRAAAQLGRAPARGPVSELRHHDQAHSTQYVTTLRAWLTAQGDLARAGEALGVHENTVRYRLRKMAEVTNLGLDDPTKRFAMMIELATADDPADEVSETDKP